MGRGEGDGERRSLGRSWYVGHTTARGGVARRVKVRWEPLSPGNTRLTTPTQPVSFRNPRRRRRLA